VHYPVIVHAAEKLCTDEKIDPSNLYIFVDYTSMPQLCKRSLSSAISSLCVYTAVCKYFLICTPTAKHADKKITVDGTTYLKRGWCRFEQWARLTTGGVSNMYVYRSDTIELLSKPEFTKWVDESINVFSGDFNRDVDKLELVNLVLGLWGYALLNLANADFKPLKDKVNENKTKVFPPRHFEGLIEMLEEIVADPKGTALASLKNSSRKLSAVHGIGLPAGNDLSAPPAEKLTA